MNGTRDDDPREIVQAFRDRTNMGPAAYAEWLRTPEAAATLDEDDEPARLLTLLQRTHVEEQTGADLGDGELELARTVVDRIDRVRSENPDDDQTRLRWRHRLMDLGHDPLR